MHKNTKLLPYERREIFRRWKERGKVTHLAKEYKVTRKTIYETLRDAKLGIFENRKSVNERWRNLERGLKKLEKTIVLLEEKQKKKDHRLKRYEKNTPGEMIHFDTKRLPLLRGEGVTQPREYLFVAIDDHSRWLYADIFPDKTSYSAAIFLEEVMLSMPFTVKGVYSDNGSEYKGRPGHPFVDICRREKLTQSFTKVKHPWTNGKAERVIRTLMEEWHSRTRTNHISRDHRRRHLYAYTSFYNQSRFHQTLESTPLERLEKYLGSVYNA
jgi:Integrase core domain